MDVVFDACAPIAIAPPVDAVQAAGIRDAFALWTERGVPALGTDGGAAIPIVFEPAAEAMHGLYDDEHGIIYINAKVTEPRVLSIVIAHELGHAMGLPHTSGDSVMAMGNTSIAPTPSDAAALTALWGACATSSSARPGT